MVSDLTYIVRFCVNSLAKDVACAVCMENLDVRHNPSQLPCAHFLCVECMKKLFQIGRRGPKCPVCMRVYEKWALVEHKRAPGGVLLAESLR